MKIKHRNQFGRFVSNPVDQSVIDSHEKFDKKEYRRLYYENNIDHFKDLGRKRYLEIKNTEEFKKTERERRLKYRYGITSKQYDELLEKQKNRCFICERHESEFNNRLHVDHNHKTDEIRGLLCYMCNRRVVNNITNPELFERAAAYLRQEGTGWFVPKKKKKKKRTRTKLKLQDVELEEKILDE